MLACSARGIGPLSLRKSIETALHPSRYTVGADDELERKKIGHFVGTHCHSDEIVISLYIPWEVNQVWYYLCSVVVILSHAWLFIPLSLKKEFGSKASFLAADSSPSTTGSEILTTPDSLVPVQKT
jgi:hypothetical protein